MLLLIAIIVDSNIDGFLLNTFFIYDWALISRHLSYLGLTTYSQSLLELNKQISELRTEITEMVGLSFILSFWGRWFEGFISRIAFMLHQQSWF